MSRLTGQSGVLVTSIALLLALQAGPAGAFTEVPVVVTPENQGKAQAAPQTPAPAAPEAGFSDPAEAAPKNEGTEVKIPGLGTVGVLPKLDFGLELLYGAQEAQERAPIEQKTGEGDLQIKGTIKHRF